MTPYHIRKVVNTYIAALDAAGIIKQRIDTSRTFQSLSTEEVMQHARALCDNVLMFLDEEWYNSEKIARHLAAAQMCLSFAGLYTLDELKNHNRS